MLVVEDDDASRELIKEVLSCIGHIPVLASNGLEAMERLLNQDVDLILSDMDMPTMSGLAFHKTVRSIRQYERIPWIFLTAYPTLSKYAKGLTPEYDLILQKPYPIEKLIALFSGKLEEI